MLQKIPSKNRKEKVEKHLNKFMIERNNIKLIISQRKILIFDVTVLKIPY
jgi:hypothetical protein